MPEMKCPSCGCRVFYVKDPDDEFEIYEFESQDGKVVFSPESESDAAPDVDADTEIYCNKCAWHGEFKTCR